MIPLSVFLIAWLVFLGLYAVMSLASVLQMLRFGIAGFGTWASTSLFLLVAFVVIAGSGFYFMSVDWTQTVDVFTWLGHTPIFPQ